MKLNSTTKRVQTMSISRQKPKEAPFSERNSRVSPQKTIKFSKNKDSKTTELRLPSIKNVVVFKNVTELGLVHAYQPDLLKNCMVKRSKSYYNYFGKEQNTIDNEIFFKSVEAHFKEWKKQLGAMMI